ncbi:MAG: ABC transporter permease, partial [Planctomycetaceae bacterium]|nr:ABC transporter permease [Planctomycetaceae bacterium]
MINNILLRRGSYFTEDRREEVIINDAFARAHNLKPGDTLHLLLNNRRQKLTIVGTAISSEYVYIVSPGSFVPDPKVYGIFYLKHSFAEDVFDFEGACNQIVGLMSPDVRDQPDRLLDEIELRLDDYGVASTTPRRDQPSHLFLMSEIDGLRVNATVVPGIFLGVAALILNVLMMRTAEQQRTIVGTLKAIGYSNRQLFVHFLKFGVAIGVLGGLFGTVGGYVLAGEITKVYVQFYEFPRLVNYPYWTILGSGLLVSVVFSALGTIRGIHMILKLAPAEAMRPKPPAKGHRTLIERVRPFWNLLDFRWQMVLRGVFRQRMRTLAGVMAASAGAALLLVTFHLRDAVDEMIEFQFDKVLLSDFDLHFKDECDIGAYYEARRLPGVDFAEPQFQLGCTFRNGHHEKQGGITGLLPNARLTIPREAGGQRIL